MLFKCKQAQKTQNSQLEGMLILKSCIVFFGYFRVSKCAPSHFNKKNWSQFQKSYRYQFPSSTFLRKFASIHFFIFWKAYYESDFDTLLNRLLTARFEIGKSTKIIPLLYIFIHSFRNELRTSKERRI